MRLFIIIDISLNLTSYILCLSNLHWRHLYNQVHGCHSYKGKENLVNIQETMNRVRTCFAVGSRQCRMLTSKKNMFWKPEIVLRRTYFCGFLNYHHAHGVSKPGRIILIIDYSPYYQVDISVLELSIKWSQNKCSQQGLGIKDGVLYQVHCGRKMPWKFLTKNRKIVFMLFNHKLHTSDFNFIAYYKTSKSLPEESEKRLIIFPMFKWIPTEIISTPYTLFLSVHPTFYIVTLIYFPHNIRDIDFFDGPGKRSPILASTTMSNGLGRQFISSVFHNSIKISQGSRKTHLYLKYAGIMTRTALVHKVLNRKYVSVKMDKSRQNNLVSSNWYYSLKGGFSPYLSLEKFTFVGPSGIDSNLDFDCQYGGLFFVPMKSEKLQPQDMLSFCGNNTLYDTPFLFSNTYGFAVYITAFHGYSFVDISFLYVIVNRCHYRYLNCFDHRFKILNTSSTCTTSLVTHGKQCTFTMYNHQRLSFIPTNITLSNVYGDIHMRPTWNSVANVSDCILEIQVQWSEELMSADNERTNIQVRSKAATFFSYRSLHYMKVKSSQCERTRYIIYMVQYMCPGYGRIVGNSSIILPGCWTYYDAKQQPVRLFFLPDYANGQIHITMNYFVCENQCFTGIITLKYSSFNGEYTESNYTEKTWIFEGKTHISFNDISHPAVVQIDVHHSPKCSPTYCLIKIEMHRDTIKEDGLRAASTYSHQNNNEYVFRRPRYVRQCQEIVDSSILTQYWVNVCP